MYAAFFVTGRRRSNRKKNVIAKAMLLFSRFCCFPADKKLSIATEITARCPMEMQALPQRRCSRGFPRSGLKGDTVAFVQGDREAAA
jgi:hypothetical protein